jgi:hypothetical protein
VRPSVGILIGIDLLPQGRSNQSTTVEVIRGENTYRWTFPLLLPYYHTGTKDCRGCLLR